MADPRAARGTHGCAAARDWHGSNVLSYQVLDCNTVDRHLTGCARQARTWPLARQRRLYGWPLPVIGGDCRTGAAGDPFIPGWFVLLLYHGRITMLSCVVRTARHSLTREVCQGSRRPNGNGEKTADPNTVHRVDTVLIHACAGARSGTGCARRLGVTWPCRRSHPAARRASGRGPRPHKGRCGACKPPQASGRGEAKPGKRKR